MLAESHVNLNGWIVVTWCHSAPLWTKHITPVCLTLALDCASSLYCSHQLFRFMYLQHNSNPSFKKVYFSHTHDELFTDYLPVNKISKHVNQNIHLQTLQLLQYSPSFMYSHYFQNTFLLSLVPIWDTFLERGSCLGLVHSSPKCFKCKGFIAKNKQINGEFVNVWF